MPKQIIQIQLLDEETGAVIETVVPETETRAVLMADGTTLQSYLDNLVIQKGDKGDTGAKGDKGDPGTPGTNGAAGSKMHNVTSAPATGLGAIGDWALNTVNGDVYEKTAAAVWTNRGNFKGAKGDTGTTGLKGDPGTPGTNGAKGDKGDPGDSVKFGTDYATGQEVKLFFKTI